MCLDPERMLYVKIISWCVVNMPRFMVGESFFQVSEEEAVESLEKATRLSEEFLQKYVYEWDTLQAEMSLLKKDLYAKFGTAINLEDK